MTRRRSLAILWLFIIYLIQPNSADGSDSLRSALEAVSRRQRDLSDDVYYLEPEGPRHHGRVVYFPQQDVEGDGQPEDIGYGYQKSIAPKTAGLFEPIALPKSELGIHDFPGHHRSHGKSKGLEKMILEYLEDQTEDDEPDIEFRGRHPDSKRSIFRERGDGHVPDALQRLYLEENDNNPIYGDGEVQNIPTSFRERFKGKGKNSGLSSAHALVRNFGGLDRDTENRHDSDDDSDEYMSVLNSIWEKYKDSNLDSLDPEDITDSDVAELMEYMDAKDEKKRQYGSGYDGGYDFFNSPLQQWSKRNKPRSESLSRPDHEGYFHALKYLTGSRDNVGPISDGDRDDELTELLIDRPNAYRNSKYNIKKRLWRDGAFDERYPYSSVAKRYPVAKRSPTYYSNPSVSHHKPSIMLSQRRKKNVNGAIQETTDPKVAKELSDIFSDSHHNQSLKSDKKENSAVLNVTKDSDKITNVNESKDIENSHKHVKKSGQKEESVPSTMHKPLDITKKSVDWSDYFGIDRRRKKSSNTDINDEWLLNQYLKAYSLSSNALKDSSNALNVAYGDILDQDYGEQKKGQDDIDSKLRAMEDLIVDQALKYTGAHEGVTDSKEIQEVKDRVISQLAAAYSLEKMRRALGEFKSSIAAQKASAPTQETTTLSNVSPAQPEKRIAVKKEKAESDSKEEKLDKKPDIDNDLKSPYLLDSQQSFPRWNAESFGPEQSGKSCPILKDIGLMCKEVANVAGDVNEVFLPLCSLHQICYLCGSELGESNSNKCDAAFLSEARNVCRDNASCRYIAHQTISALHTMKTEMSPISCDWQNHPCLAYFLSIAAR